MEACQTAFARFAYQLGSDGGNEGLPNFPKSAEVNAPPSSNNTDAKLKRIYHAVTSVVRSLPKRERWTNIPRPQREALQAL